MNETHVENIHRIVPGFTFPAADILPNLSWWPGRRMVARPVVVEAKTSGDNVQERQQGRGNSGRVEIVGN
jgi:hypothetical protein